MTLKEAIKLVAWATANFPAMQERDMRPTAELWYRMLADIPYEVAEKALMSVLAKAKYFPTVAEIREAAADIINPQLPSAMDAWGEVARAVRDYGYYRQEEALNSLSPITRRVVENIGWHEICLCEQPDIIRGQFRMAYEQYAKREREETVLPAEVKQLAGDRVRVLSLIDKIGKALPGGSVGGVSNG